MGGIVPGVVLAAGRSRRMGRPKPLLPVSSPHETFASRIVDVLRRGGVDDVVVVAGPDATPVRTALAGSSPPPRIVINPDPDAGQLTSLQTGLCAISRPGVGAVLVTLVDVPLIDADIVRALLETHRRTGAPIVRPVAPDGRHGHPVVFDRALFDELQEADPEIGAKTVIRAHLADAVDVPTTAPGPFLDVDTPEAYQRVFRRPVPPVTRSPGEIR